MKKSVPVRILTAAAGVLLLAGCGCAAAEAFFGVPVTAAVGGFLTAGNALAMLGKLTALAVTAVLAAAAIICALPGRKPKQRDYVMQKGENGPIGISVRAIEKQVRACVAKHDVIADAEISVREARDGIIILLNVDQVSGVSIPLSVGLLQKQIRQYVTGCTGVDVQEVRVMVENNTENQVASAFAVEDAVCPPVPRAVEEFHAERQATAEPTAAAQETPAPAPEAAAEPAPVAIPVQLPVAAEQPEEAAEEDERPLHQRVFGAEELPATVPVPPEMTAEPPVEAAAVPESEPAEAEIPAAQEAEAAEPSDAEEDWSEPLLQAAAEAVLAEGSAEPVLTDDAAVQTEEASGETADAKAEAEETALPDMYY